MCTGFLEVKDLAFWEEDVIFKYKKYEEI